MLAAQWILRGPGSGARQTFDRAMYGLIPDFHIKFELQHAEAIKRAVAENFGIGCLSEMTVEQSLARGSLVKFHVPQLDFKRKFYFLLHKKKCQRTAI